jgi:hypothetical protein
LKKALDSVLTMRPSDTPLFNAIGDVAHDMGDNPNGAVRMLLVFSDGISSTPYDADLAQGAYAVQSAKRHGVSIFPVQVVQGVNPYYSAMSLMSIPTVTSSIGYFQALGQDTGGKSYVHPATDSVVPEVLKSIAKQVLPYTYVAGYYPTSTGQNKRHEVQVVLRDKNKGELSGGNRIVVH